MNPVRFLPSRALGRGPQAGPALAPTGGLRADASGRAVPGRGLIPAFTVTGLIGLSLVLALNPSESIPWKSFYDQRRALEIALIALISLGFVLTWSVRRLACGPLSELGSRFQIGLVLFFALGLAASTQARYPTWALLEWGTLLGLALLTSALAGARRHAGRGGDWLLLTTVFAAVTLNLADFLALYGWATWYHGVGIDWESPFHNFGNVRFFNQVQSWSLPLLAACTVWSRRLNRTLFLLVGGVSAFWWALLFATGGRGAILGVTVGILLTSLFPWAALRAWARINLGLAAAGLLVYALVFLAFADLPAPGFERSITASLDDREGRIQLWAQALELIGRHPFLGVGPLHFMLEGPLPGYGHPHNALLQLGAEWGVPAALTAIGLALAGLGAWLRSTRTRRVSGDAPHDSGILEASLTCALLTGAAHAMVSGVVVMPASQLFMAVTVGWLWGLSGRPGAEREKADQGGSTKEYRRALFGASLATLLAVLPASLATGLSLDSAQAEYTKMGHKFHPRFWRQGDLRLPPWQAFSFPSQWNQDEGRT